MQKKSLAIYTVLVGGYDAISNPIVIEPNVDYICFVDRMHIDNMVSDVWRFEVVDEPIKDNGRLSRYPKILPHKTILSNYDYSLYIDANVIINSEFIYSRIDELITTGIKVSMIKHPFRDCVYQEGYVCIAGLKGGWVDILRQLFFLKRKGIPKHSGLFEAGVIFRVHNDPEVIAMDEMWWNNFMRFSKRDQLSLVYAKDKNKINIEPFLSDGYSIRNHNSFKVIKHLPQKPTKVQIIRGKVVGLLYGISKKLLKE